MNPLRYVARYLFRRSLLETGPAHTFARLCTSQHLEDLQLLASLTAIVAIGIIYGIVTGMLASNATFVGGLVAATAAVLNWAYQSGSRRIGAVDLFACEISVICRVNLVVNFAQTSVDQAARAHGFAERPTNRATQESSDALTDAEDRDPGKFTSEEHARL
jgi:hypothetical protein